MKNVKKLLALTLATVMTAGVVSGCSTKTSSTSGANSAAAGAKEIYFLNYKPEVVDQYTAIAAEYKKETGVTVKLVTAASNTYGTTLQSEMAKADAPSIFQINGPVGYAQWKDYCANQKDTKLYSYLSDKSMAITGDDGGVYGIPYTIEGYGIIYNEAIMKKYFALSNKAVSISSTAEINNYATLKSVVEDMTKNKAALGIKGVFASTSLSNGEQWRWTNHLASVPFFFEFKENTKYNNVISAGLATPEASFKYAPNYKNIFDLYLNNSTTDPKLLGSKSVNDSMAEFALGQCAMVQNGNWAWGQISGVSGNVVNANDVKFMPIYMGVSGEEKQGICIGTEAYFAINSKVSAAEQKASEDFLNWLFSSPIGKVYVTNSLGFIAPFNTFSATERPTDPLAKDILNWESKTDVTNVAWAFDSFPSNTFETDMGAGLLQYSQGKETWDQVVSGVKNSWKTEYAASKS